MTRARWRRGTLVVGVAVLVVAGCGGGGPGPAATTPTAAPMTTATATAGSPGRGPERIIVVVEENHAYDQIINNPHAPFLNHLATTGTLLSGYYAITHPSLPNYLALTSGDTHHITSDCGDCNIDAPNLADQLERANITWTAYQQGLPTPCSDVHTSGAYAKKHNPFMYFHSIRDDPARCAKIVPAQRLEGDLATGRLARFVFITPDLAHDMHGPPTGGSGGGLVRAADDWLRALYAKLAASPAWAQDTRLVITWDEGTRDGGGGSCCGGLGGGGRVATIIAGPRVHPARDPHSYDHYALLRSIETGFGLPPLGHAADPSSITIPAIANPPA